MELWIIFLLNESEFVRLMTEILYHQLYIIYEISGYFPYKPLNFKVGLI